MRADVLVQVLTFLADYGHELIVGMGSIICTGVAAYFVVGQKLAFIQGQLSQLLHVDKKVGEHGAKLELHGARIDRNAMDLAAAHDKLRKLEKSLSPASIHPKS